MLFIIGPLGLFLFYRIILPLIWCVHFMFKEGGGSLNYILLAHIIYLLIMFVFIVFTFVRLSRYFSRVATPQLSGKKMSLVSYVPVFGCLIGFAVLGGNVPIFSGGGSNAVMNFSSNNKITAWLVFGMFDLFMLWAIIVALYSKSNLKKILFYFASISMGLATGSKVTFLAFITKLFIVRYCLTGKSPRFFKLALSVFLGIGFIFIQFIRTESVDISSLFIGVKIFSTLVYDSATSYLILMFDRDAVSLAQVYANEIGDFSSVRYFLNPFIAFFTGSGIPASIGPYLNQLLFGSTTENGVNPTIFFELIFSTGQVEMAVLSFLIGPLMILVHEKFIYLASRVATYSHAMSAAYFLAAFYALTFLSDSLFAIRSSVFVLVPILSVLFLRSLSKSTKS